MNAWKGGISDTALEIQMWSVCEEYKNDLGGNWPILPERFEGNYAIQPFRAVLLNMFYNTKKWTLTSIVD